MRVIRFFLWSLVWLVVLVWGIWAFGALYFDFPIVRLGALAAGALAVAVVGTIIFARPALTRLLVVVSMLAVVTAWWFTLKPSNGRNWQPDVAETAWAEIEGDTVTLHNIRNFDYRTETDFTPHWETRTVRLSQIAGVDLAITYWGSPLIAHPIASFRFADAVPVCISIETRKAVGQSYSAVRGLYRQFTLIYIVADERDPIRLRTNYRKGEDVYLYRTLATPEQARRRFLEYINTINALHAQPRWYNAVTTNCTTAIRAQRPTGQRAPWDWRILANGKADELLYGRHVIADGGISFAELKQRSHINERARAADQDPEFSQRIREGVPGFRP